MGGDLLEVEQSMLRAKTMRQAMDLSCEPEVGPEVLQRLRYRVRIKRDDTLGE